MRFLLNLTALPWEEAVPYLQYIREHGILQFINTYVRMKDRITMSCYGATRWSIT